MKPLIVFNYFLLSRIPFFFLELSFSILISVSLPFSRVYLSRCLSFLDYVYLALFHCLRVFSLVFLLPFCLGLWNVTWAPLAPPPTGPAPCVWSWWREGVKGLEGAWIWLGEFEWTRAAGETTRLKNVICDARQSEKAVRRATAYKPCRRPEMLSNTVASFLPDIWMRINCLQLIIREVSKVQCDCAKVWVCRAVAQQDLLCFFGEVFCCPQSGVHCNLSFSKTKFVLQRLFASWSINSGGFTLHRWGLFYCLFGSASSCSWLWPVPTKMCKKTDFPGERSVDLPGPERD